MTIDGHVGVPITTNVASSSFTDSPESFPTAVTPAILV
jgi:hypothetical protein